MQLNAIFLFLGDLGGGEIMVILVVFLLLFGANKIPGIARSVGSGIREFKDATNGIKNEIERSLNEEPKPRRRPVTPVVQDQPEILPAAEYRPENTDEEPKSLS